MKGLKCTTSNCEFNHACHCSAGIINIASNANCKTKLKRKYGILDQEFTNLEAAEEFDYSLNEDILIECDSVHCIYNNAHRCNNDIVTVADGAIRTKCKSKEINVSN